MTRSQTVALLLGAAVVVVGAGIAWRVHLMQAQTDHPLAMAAGAPGAAPAATEPSASTLPPSEAAPAQASAQTTGIPPDETIAPPAIELTPTLPQFDTVRVEPSGDAVVAGHGQPNAHVALLENGTSIAETDSDGAGNFVIIPTPLAPGNYELTLRSERPGKTPHDSEQAVTVAVPAKGGKNLVVAMAEPGQPTKVLSDTAAPVAKPPSAAPATGASAGPPPSVVIRTSDVDKDGLYATGSATKPGEHLRIYLNGTRIADLTAAADGHWSLTVKRGLTPGHYILRADALDATVGKVVARAEVAFDVPEVVAAAEPNAPASMPAVASDAAPAPPAAVAAPSRHASSEAPVTNDAIVPNLSTAKVVHGDSLWRISRKVFGLGIRYTLIYEANAAQIRNPNLIYPGQVFVVPPKK